VRGVEPHLEHDLGLAAVDAITHEWSWCCGAEQTLSGIGGAR